MRKFQLGLAGESGKDEAWGLIRGMIKGPKEREPEDIDFWIAEESVKCLEDPSWRKVETLHNKLSSRST